MTINITKIETRERIAIETDAGSAHLSSGMVRQPENPELRVRIKIGVTADNIKAELAQQLGVRPAELNNIWFHVNRNHTLAVALGNAPPEQWPEDVVWVNSPPPRG